MRLFVWPLIATLGVLSAAPASAFERITQPNDFTSLIAGRELSRLGISLVVTPDGSITGRGMGAPVSGAWQWQEGFFCRTLEWGTRDLGHNCQTVLRDGDRVRFVADRGVGDHADFRLR